MTKTKTISATGPNGAFSGDIIVTDKTIIKKIKNNESNLIEEQRVVVYDIESRVNGHLFGSVNKNIDDELVLEVEILRHNGLLKTHLTKLANTVIGKSVRERMTEMGFIDTTEQKVHDLSEWIKDETRWGLENKGKANNRRKTA